ncbi:MAG: hypothetical protein Q7U64_05510 [Desulfocapsaceae bacterium]|nr:hypothetical protein [Desulfocapsaceae bacterium]
MSIPTSPKIKAMTNATPLSLPSIDGAAGKRSAARTPKSRTTVIDLSVLLLSAGPADII